MRKILILSTILLIAIPALATTITNVLVLTWNQPVGYRSTLYSSSNLVSGWTQFSTSSPPVAVSSSAQQAFFYVTVEPNNDPSILIYTNDPNAEGIKPLDTNGVGVAYDQTGMHGTYYWSPNDQSWH